MNDERVPVGAILCDENPANGVRIERVCAETVDRFSRERDETAVAKNFGGAGDGIMVVGGQDDSFHGWQDKRLCYDGRAKMKNTAILLVDCPDRKGIVAAISDFLYRHNANILHADQHQDAERGLFLMRAEWDLADFDLQVDRLGEHFPPLAHRFRLLWPLDRW